MSSKWRRFELLLPLQFNDGREVPADWLAETVRDAKLPGLSLSWRRGLYHTTNPVQQPFDETQRSGTSIA
jgi:hypothetical protein